MARILSQDRRRQRGWRWFNSWVSRSAIPLDEGESAYFRTLAWRSSGVFSIDGELLVTNQRIVFRENARVFRRPQTDFYPLAIVECTTVGPQRPGGRQLNIHQWDGAIAGMFVWAGGLAAEVIEAALIEYRKGKPGAVVADG